MQIRINNSYNTLNQQRQSFKRLDLQQAQKLAKKAKLAAKHTSDRSTSILALGIGKIASLKATQNLVNWLKNKNYQEHLAAFVGCTLSGFYML